MQRWSIVLVLALLLPGLAQAAHTHDHRYVVTGRVLDGEGLPVGEATVRAELIGPGTDVPAQAPRTNCLGDFIAVFRVASVEEAQVRVTLNQVEETIEPDPVLRRTFVGLEVPGAVSDSDCQEARRNFTQQQVVTGRILVPPGQPAQNARVNVTIELDTGGQLSQAARTNSAGDFAVGFQSTRFSPGDRVVLESLGERWTEPLNVTWGITVADSIRTLPEERSDTRWVVAGIVVVLALGGLVYVLWLRRPG